MIRDVRFWALAVVVLAGCITMIVAPRAVVQAAYPNLTFGIDDVDSSPPKYVSAEWDSLNSSDGGLCYRHARIRVQLETSGGLWSTFYSSVQLPITTTLFYEQIGDNAGANANSDDLWRAELTVVYGECDSNSNTMNTTLTYTSNEVAEQNIPAAATQTPTITPTPTDTPTPTATPTATPTPIYLSLIHI